MRIIDKNFHVERYVGYMKLKCLVRYVEDGQVNGQDDISYDEQDEGVDAKMPFMEKEYVNKKYDNYEYYWCPIIDIDEGKIINWPNGTTAFIHYKTVDCNKIQFFENLTEEPIKLFYDGKTLPFYEGYVPKILDCERDGYGDYIIMNINEEGYIEKWNRDSIKDIFDGEEQNFSTEDDVF